MGACLIALKGYPRTETVSLTERTVTDLGAWHDYRYVDTSSIPKGTLTWSTFTSYPGRGSKTVTFSITSIPNYQSLSVDNIAIIYAGLNPLTDAAASYLTRSYNASNGVVTVSLRSAGTISFDTNGSGYGVQIRVYYIA